MINEFAVEPQVMEDPENATTALAGRLGDGTLALVLGAGTSANVGLPMWPELVARCCEGSGVHHDIDLAAPDRTSTDHLLHLMHEVKKKERRYLELVREMLYRDADPEWVDSRDQPLLRAIGTLLMGVRSGNIGDVITYNFDDVIELFLGYHGFITQSIAGFPFLTTNADARIYHPHGFLPREGKPSEGILFDRTSYNDRFAAVQPIDALWTETVRALLYSKQAIFVGLSGRDPLFRIILPKVADHVGTENDAGRRFVGYWLMKADGDEELLDEIRSDYRCAVVQFDQYDEIPRFLFGVRQACAKSRR